MPVLLALALVGSGACSGTNGAAVAKPAQPSRDPLLVTLDSQVFRGKPRVLEQIRASPHAYFRFINVRFADAVCKRFESVTKDDPVVNLHGDAHLEQYAVSATDRGLADFDAATTGPAALDLMRFLVSVRLGLRQRGWSDAGKGVVEAFLNGYRDALERPDLEPPEPDVARRFRSRVDATPAQWLDRMEGLMHPLDAKTRDTLDKAGREYFATMREQDPKLTEGFFSMKKAGSLEVGIGSAFEQKYLARIEGPTAAPEDDVLLEVKQVPDLGGVRCIEGSRRIDPFRIIVGQSRLGSGDHRLLGYLMLDRKAFYVQSWRVNYVELDIDGYASAAELAQVARDVGNQLGRGHPKLIAAPHDMQLRRALVRVLARDEKLLDQVAIELEARILAAWEAARTHTGP